MTLDKLVTDRNGNRFTFLSKRLTLYVMMFLLKFTNSISQVSVLELGTIPEPVTNNAVCVGFINGKPYLYTFGD